MARAFHLLMLLAVLASLPIGGCRSFGEPAKPPPRKMNGAHASRQLIIKFRPDTISCSPEGIARFSSTRKVSLEFVRTMSGGACVVKQFAGSEKDLLRGQKTLKEDPAVEYVEPDAVMEAF